MQPSPFLRYYQYLANYISTVIPSRTPKTLTQTDVCRRLKSMIMCYQGVKVKFNQGEGTWKKERGSGIHVIHRHK